MDAAIEIENLGFAYTANQWIFRNCSAAIPKGSVVSLIGPNGSGKTTLLRLLLKTLQPLEGRIRLQGTTAFVPQLAQNNFAFQVIDMVLMGLTRRLGLFGMPSKADSGEALRTLALFGMERMAYRPFRHLSGGERQMVLFARALVSGCEMLFLDEPASALDLKNQAYVLGWVRRLSVERGLTIVMSTHHPAHADAVSTHVLLMQLDRTARFGRREEVLTEENLEEAFGVAVRRVPYLVNGEWASSLVPAVFQA